MCPPFSWCEDRHRSISNMSEFPGRSRHMGHSGQFGTEPKNGHFFWKSRWNCKILEKNTKEIDFRPYWIWGKLIFWFLNHESNSTITSCPGATFWKYWILVNFIKKVFIFLGFNKFYCKFAIIINQKRQQLPEII